MFLEIVLEINYSSLQPFQPDSADFAAHLQPFAQNYIDDKNKTFGVCYAMTLFMSIIYLCHSWFHDKLTLFYLYLYDIYFLCD